MAILNNSADAIRLLDAKGTPIFANDALFSLLGLARRRRDNGSVMPRVPTGIARQWRKEDRKALKSSGTSQVEECLQIGDREVVLDVTERRQNERTAARQRDEIAHLSRVAALGELSGSLAHEINQPLMGILSNAQAAQRFLAQDPPDLAEVRDILADIVTERLLAKVDWDAVRMNALTSGLLGLWRGTSPGGAAEKGQAAPLAPPLCGRRQKTLFLAAPAGDQPHRHRPAVRGGPGRADVGALGVVVERHAANAADVLYAVRQSLELLQSRQQPVRVTGNAVAKGQCRQRVGRIVPVSYTHLTLPTSDLV